MGKCHRWSGAKWIYNEETTQIRSVRTDATGIYCWSVDYEKCSDFQANCPNRLTSQICDADDKKQHFKWDADSGRIEMVHAPQKCLTYSAKWKGYTNLVTCTGIRSETRTVGVDAGTLREWGYPVGGGFQMGYKPDTNIRQIQTLNPDPADDTLYCGGVDWRRKKRGPVNGQQVVLRRCDLRTSFKANIYMDKFFLHEGKIKDITNYSSQKRCWTWMTNDDTVKTYRGVYGNC